jgi:DNA polymerase-3 subunit alpha
MLAERIEKEEDVKTLIEMAQSLEGMTRNIGMHAGGGDCAGQADRLLPVPAARQRSAVGQYDKDDVEPSAW